MIMPDPPKASHGKTGKGDYLNYEDFICMVQTQMQERLGGDAQIQLHQVMKNNSVVLDALSISEGDSGVSPTVYLNDYYREYRDGTSIPELLDQMETTYRNNRLQLPFDTSFYTDFEKVKDRLACRLISRSKNRELLQKVPYRPFLDLALVVYYCFEDSQLGTGTILVYKNHQENWRVSEEVLFETARENTLRIQPEEFLSMRSILEKYRECGRAAEEIEAMYVLTNRSNYFGAASLLFDSVLQKIAQELQDDFWVLPSSIHECIIVPVSFPATREELQEMVREINRCEVAAEDFLSDEVYLYRREVHKLSI